MSEPFGFFSLILGVANSFLIFIFLSFIVIVTSEAFEVSLGELMLVSTGVGDAEADEGGYKKREGAPRITDDTQKACALYNYFRQYNPNKTKNIDTIQLAKNLCFAAFPEGQRFGLRLEEPPVLSGYGVSASGLVKRNFKLFQYTRFINKEIILENSLNAVLVGRRARGSYGNGACMGLAPLACIKDFHQLSTDQLNQIAKEVAEITHNHPDGIGSAQAMAIAMQHIQILKRSDGAISTKEVLGAVKEQVKNCNIKNCCDQMAGKCVEFPAFNLNKLSPNRAEASSGIKKLTGSWGPNSVIVAIYLALNSFEKNQSQTELLQDVEKYCNDRDTIGSMSLSLRVLIDDGFDDSIKDDRIKTVIDQIPAFLGISKVVEEYRNRR